MAPQSRGKQKAALEGRLRILGGENRIRTGDEGFAGLCLTTWPSRRLSKGAGRRRPTPSDQWSGQRGSNPRPSPWQGDALPAEPCPRREKIYYAKQMADARKSFTFLGLFEMTQNVRPGGLPVVARAARGREAARRSLAHGGLLVVARRSSGLGPPVATLRPPASREPPVVARATRGSSEVARARGVARALGGSCRLQRVTRRLDN